MWNSERCWESAFVSGMRRECVWVGGIRAKNRICESYMPGENGACVEGVESGFRRYVVRRRVPSFLSY